MSVAARVGPWLVALAAAAVPASAQERDQVPVFGTGAEAITVDVLVLDSKGLPIRGLKASDFTVREDGKPQAIVGFEARDLATAPPPEAADAAIGLPRAAGEEREAPGRTLGFLIDDLGMNQRGTAAIEAVGRWVRERADPRDEVTLATTSGLVEWQGVIGSGRAELLDALGSIRTRKRDRQSARGGSQSARGGGGLSDWDAYRIYSGRKETNAEQRALAFEVYDDWRNRARAIVTAIGAFSRAHAEDRGRKPLFLISQGFISDGDLRQFDDAIDLAQRGNVAVYFVDPRGLVAGEYAPPDVPSAGGLEPEAPVTGSSGRSGFGDSIWEVTHHLDLGGGEAIAQGSGGAVIRDTNDLEGRLAEAVDESSAYYLLGIQPAAPDDGKWHEIDVKVAVKGATVRARRGYHASAQTLVERRAQAAREKPKEKEKEKEAVVSAPAAAKPEPAAPGIPTTAPAADAASPSVPVFASQADAITVDVVVVDKDGRPVRERRRARPATSSRCPPAGASTPSSSTTSGSSRRTCPPS
jgi:VWFA-related protein